MLLTAIPVSAQTAHLSGTVLDETGAALPGVLVELRSGAAASADTER